MVSVVEFRGKDQQEENYVSIALKDLVNCIVNFHLRSYFIAFQHNQNVEEDSIRARIYIRWEKEAATEVEETPLGNSEHYEQFRIVRDAVC